MPFEIYVTRDEAVKINNLRREFADNPVKKYQEIYEQVFCVRTGEILKKLGKPDWIMIEDGGWHKKVVDLKEFD